MNTLGKLAFLAIGGGLLYKGYTLIRSFNSFSEIAVSMEKISVKTTLSDGLIIMVNPLIKNPTKSSMTISQPFVKLFSQGREVATSNILNKTHVIQAQSQHLLDTVQIKLSWEEVSTIAQNMKVKLPAGTVGNKILYLLANYKPVINSSALTAQVITYANNVYYKSDPIKIEF